jgi:Coenzyme PQQ synthesis protein D (PqqD)
MTSNKKLRRASDSAWRRVDEEVAIISMEANRIRLLNPVGSFVWERCDGATIDELVAQVCEIYQIDAATARHDVTAFVDDLIQRGLVSTEVAA